MMNDLQNYEKLLCFFERKVHKDFLKLLKTLLRFAKTLRQAQYKLQTHQRKKEFRKLFCYSEGI